MGKSGKDYTGKHRSGKVSWGNQGTREVNPTHGFDPDPIRTVQLGHMPATMMMSSITNQTLRHGAAQNANKYLAMSRHPSAGGRTMEFLATAKEQSQRALGHHANLLAAQSQILPMEKMQGRSTSFLIGRKMPEREEKMKD